MGDTADVGMQVGFKELEEYALAHSDPVESLPSGQAEKAEIMLSMYVK